MTGDIGQSDSVFNQWLCRFSLTEGRVAILDPVTVVQCHLGTQVKGLPMKTLL